MATVEMRVYFPSFCMLQVERSTLKSLNNLNHPLTCREGCDLKLVDSLRQYPSWMLYFLEISGVQQTFLCSLFLILDVIILLN